MTDRSQRPTYAELKAKHGENWGLSPPPDDKARKEITVAKIQQANRIAFERECATAGVDPAKGVSPSLLKIIMTAA